jgi:hypothetical protein
MLIEYIRLVKRKTHPQGMKDDQCKKESYDE